MIWDAIHIALRNLTRHRLRTLLTVCGIIIGTAAVTAVFSIGESGKAQIIELFRSFGVNGVIISAPVSTRGSTGSLSASEIDEVRETVDGVSAVMPFIYKNARISIDRAGMSCYALGIGDNALQIASVSAEHGRGFSYFEIASSARVCMLDTVMAQKIYKRDNIVGREIVLSVNGYSEMFTVIGVMGDGDAAVGNIIGTYFPTLVYVPYTTLMELTGDDSFESFVVTLDEGADSGLAVDRIITRLEGRSGVSGYRSENMSKQQDKIERIIDIITLIISAIASISLIVGGMGVMTVMLVAVNERKREIGLKKAVGATKRMIMNEFVAEAAIISLMGGAAGAAVGTALIYVAGAILKIATVPNVGILLASVGFCGIIGVVFSVYPARKAAELDPIICLKYE